MNWTTALVFFLSLALSVASQTCFENSILIGMGLPQCDSSHTYQSLTNVCLGKEGDVMIDPIRSYTSLVFNSEDGNPILLCYRMGVIDGDCITQCSNGSCAECIDATCLEPTPNCVCEGWFLTKVLNIFNDTYSMADASCTVMASKIYGEAPRANQGTTKDIPQADHFGSLIPNSLSKRSTLDGSTYITRSGDRISVYTSNTDIKTTRFSKDTWSWTITSQDLAINYDLPDDVFISNGQVLVQVMTGTKPLAYESFEVIAKFKCNIRDCLICQEAWDNWSCLPWRFRTLVISATTLIFVLIFIGLPLATLAIAKVIIFVLNAILLVFVGKRGLRKIRVWKRVVRAINAPWSFVRNELSYDDEDNLMSKEVRSPLVSSSFDQKDGSATVTMDQLSTIIRNLSHPIKTKEESGGFSIQLYTAPIPILMLILLMMVANTNAVSCASGTTSVGTLDVCDDYGSYKVCDEVFNEVATISNVYQSACYTMTELSSGSLAYQVFINYQEDMNCIGLVDQYYWSSWKGAQVTNDYCWIDDHCSDQKCATVQDDESGSGAISISGNMNYPGFSHCDRYDQSYLEGCLIPDEDSCAFSRATIVPTGPIYKISVLGQGRRTPLTQIQIVDSTGNVQTASGYTIGKPIVNGNFSLTITAEIPPIPTNFMNLAIVQDMTNSDPTKRDAWLCSVSQVGSPVAGSIGDIQSPTMAGLRAPGTNAFQIADDLISYTMNEGTAVHRFVSPGSIGNQCYKLPSSLNGDSWYLASGGSELCTYKHNSGAIQVVLTTLSPFKVTVNQNVVCPELTLVNASGCYNCVQGIKVTISAKSTCSAGGVTITYSNMNVVTLFTSSLILTTDYQNYDIFGSTTQMENGFFVEICGASKCNKVNVVFQASAYTVVTPDNNSTSPNGTVTSHSNNGLFHSIGTFFEDIFKGIASWWNYLFLAVIVIVVIVLVVVLGPDLIRLLGFLIKSVDNGARKGVKYMKITTTSLKKTSEEDKKEA